MTARPKRLTSFGFWHRTRSKLWAPHCDRIRLFMDSPTMRSRLVEASRLGFLPDYILLPPTYHPKRHRTWIFFEPAPYITQDENRRLIPSTWPLSREPTHTLKPGLRDEGFFAREGFS